MKKYVYSEAKQVVVCGDFARWALAQSCGVGLYFHDASSVYHFGIQRYTKYFITSKQIKSAKYNKKSTQPKLCANLNCIANSISA